MEFFDDFMDLVLNSESKLVNNFCRYGLLAVILVVVGLFKSGVK